MGDAPDRVFVEIDKYGLPQQAYLGGDTEGLHEYLRADGPTITAYREALRTMGLDPDSIAREAEKEAQ